LELLTNASASVKPGGKLVYSVCSLTRAETTEVVEAFESRLPDFTPRLISNPLAPASFPITHLFLWPQQFSGNGMFIAVWDRHRR
jgi:16S rRNA (cytosine967-C5)-methyltransferase